MSSVKFIAITKPISQIANTPEEFIAYCARVSNPTNQLNHETSAKLLSYCIKHKHWSIFETCHMTLEIITSRGVAAQILRHRSFSFQEFSQRYSEAHNFEIYPARRQDLKNKQNSIDDMEKDDKIWFNWAQESINNQALFLYREALKRGIAKEQARFLLPLSTETKLYVTGSIRSWIHYIDVRCDESTQKEHRDIALECRRILNEQLPTIGRALEWEKN